MPTPRPRRATIRATSARTASPEGLAAALGAIRGQQARDVLLRPLAEEKDREVLFGVAGALRTGFGDDPEVEKAL